MGPWVCDSFRQKFFNELFFTQGQNLVQLVACFSTGVQYCVHNFYICQCVASIVCIELLVSANILGLGCCIALLFVSAFGSVQHCFNFFF